MGGLAEALHYPAWGEAVPPYADLQPGGPLARYRASGTRRGSGGEGGTRVGA